jgi:hypothetical protein
MNISISIAEYPIHEPEGDFETHGDYTIKIVEGGCAVIQYTGTAAKVAVPDAIGGKTVVALGDGEFKFYPVGNYIFGGNRTMKSITIPAGVTFIEQYAFVDWRPEAIHVHEGNQHYSSEDGVLFDKKKRNLIRYPIDKKDKSYTVPKGVKILKERCFWGCEFENLILPDGLTKIEVEAVHECHSLKSIIIPKSVKFIGFNAFCNCRSLTSVILPTNKTKIDMRAFYNCYEIKSLEIPEGIKSIGSDVFTLRDLKSVTVPASVTNLDYSAFSCPNLEEFVVDKDNPNYFSDGGILFDRRSNNIISYPAGRKTADYVIPEGTAEIKDSMFTECKYLESITLPESV